MSISPRWRVARRGGRGGLWPDRPGRFPAAIGIDRAPRRLRALAGAGGRTEEARNRLVGKGEGEMGALFKAMAVATARCRRRGIRNRARLK